MPGKSLAEKVESKQEARAAGVQKTMDEWLTTYSDDFAAALPQYVDRERFIRLALNELRWSPQLRDCDVPSVIGAMMTCAQLGLEPSGPLNHVYMTPRNVNVGTKERPQWVKRVQLTVGYQGYIELAQRTGAVKTITADVVCERDEFDMWVEDGNQRLRHRPKIFSDRGPIIGAYAVAAMVNGDVICRAVDLDELDRAKQKSDAGRANKGPWVTDWESMAMKTAIRRLWKWLPKTEAAAAGYNVDGIVVVDRPELAVTEARQVPVLDVVSDTEEPADEPEKVRDDSPAEVLTTAEAPDEVIPPAEDPTRPFDEPEGE